MMEKVADEDVSGGKKKISGWKKAGIIIGAAAALYLLLSLFFQYHYFIGTKIHGVSCGFRSVDRTKELLKEKIDSYEIEILERDGVTETVTSEEIGLAFVDDGKLEAIKEAQKGYAWITALFGDNEYDDGATIEADAEKFEERVAALSAFDESKVIAPVDAYSEYVPSENAYTIVEEVYGNTLKEKAFAKQLKKEAEKLSEEFDAEPYYRNPEYKSDSEEVIAANETLNKYVGTELTYDFEDRQETLDGTTIHKWLYVDADQKVKIRKAKVEKYVAKLADRYDTVGVKREFTSIAGNHVTVEGGTYGWKIDQEAETEKLIKFIKKGKQGTREPEYEHVAKSREEFDIGDTYVEVDLSSQYMWYYKDGKILVSTPVVTGDVTKGRGTPTGVYYILYKTTDYTLTGEDYASDVDYWLPFIHSGVGIHDSSWRNSYGGSIYLGDGSHGCVNTPKSAVRTIYNNIESTYPVVVHN